MKHSDTLEIISCSDNATINATIIKSNGVARVRNANGKKVFIDASNNVTVKEADAD